MDLKTSTPSSVTTVQAAAKDWGSLRQQITPYARRQKFRHRDHETHKDASDGQHQPGSENREHNLRDDREGAEHIDITI